MISGNLTAPTQLFNQVASLSTTPLGGFTSSNWSSLVSLLTDVLTNPFFYCIIGVILLMTILPTFEDD